MTEPVLRRFSPWLAVLLAAAALIGLAAQFAAQYSRTPDLLTAVWALLRYFTILTNGLVAAVFLRAAFRPVNPALLNGTILFILLVGVVNFVMLGPPEHATAADRIGDALHHYATPLLALAYWLLAAPRGGLGWRAPLIWAVYPLAYLGYALIRAAADGKYPYPFLDVHKFGAGVVAANCATIAAGFVGAGFALVALDKGRAGNGRG
jgi:hypothetical protein